MGLEIKGSRAGVLTAAVSAGLALAMAGSILAQSTSSSVPAASTTAGQGQTQSQAQTQTTPQPAGQASPQAAGQNTPQVAPGTTPVAGDSPAPAATPDKASASDKPASSDKTSSANASSPSASGTDKDKKPAPGTEPVAGDQAAPQVNPEKVIEPGSQKVSVKPGSIEDVNAVGNRDIGGRGVGNWYSTDSEIKMGKMYADEVEKSTRFITDPVVVEYVNRIGQNIVKNSDCKVPFTIKVIDSDEINAMALPGGFFYVNSGLILNADEEAELAGVMAHETAHVCAHHAAREMTRLNYAQIGMVPLMILLPYTWTGYGIYEAAQLAIPITFLQFSRDFEAQADYLGVQYMYKSGYDPQAFITFFEKVQALEKRKPGLVAKAFSDHPQTPDRILHTQEEIARILPAKDEYTVTTSEFDDVKARLARIENKRRLIDTKDNNKPSLRRASTTSTDPTSSTGSSTSGSSTTGSSDPNDQPTLHRRDDQN